MKHNERLIWAVAIILVDIMFFVVPLAALVGAYVLLARPAWFKDFVDKVYQSNA